MQAVEEIHALKEAVFSEQARVQACIAQLNAMSSKMEDLADENGTLRKKAGVPEADKASAVVKQLASSLLNKDSIAWTPVACHHGHL